MSTGCQRFYHITRVLYATVCDNWNLEFLGYLGALHHRGNLWYSHACDHPGSTDGTRTHPDFDCVCAGFSQTCSTFGAGHVPCNHINRRKSALNLPNTIHHSLGMAVGGIQYDQVCPGLDQGLNPGVPIRSYSDRSSWLSLSGTATVVDDSTKLEELWNTFTDAWLEGGPENPNNVLIRIEADSAEYWDSPGTPDVRPEIVDLTGLTSAQTWYRLRAEISKLSATSARIDAPEYCIGCKMCEMRCPDFAIFVNYEEKTG